MSGFSFGNQKFVEVGSTVEPADRVLVRTESGTIVAVPLSALSVVGGLDYPVADGDANAFLKTDGAGALAFAPGVIMKQVTFTEANQGAAGAYVASVAVPAGAWILDIFVVNRALWTDATSAVLIAGVNGDDADGYYASVNLKATDLLVGQILSLSGDTNDVGGKAGAYITAASATYVLGGGTSARLMAAAATIDFTVTVGAGGGTAGRTTAGVIYVLPFSTAAGVFTAS